jgi:hypothetical protein
VLQRLIGAQNHRHGANHEHHGAPGGGLRKNGRGTAWAEGRLAACAAKCTRQIRCFSALEQHHDDQNETIEHEKDAEEPAGKSKSGGNDAETDQQRNGPFHPTWHFETSLNLIRLDAALTGRPKAY